MRRRLAFVTVAAVLTASCGGGDDKLGAIERGLGQIPLTAHDSALAEGSLVRVEVADLVAVAESQRLDAPSPDKNDDDIIEFVAQTVSNARDRDRITVMWSGLLNLPFASPVDIAAETGLDVGAVESFASIENLPESFAVYTGELELSSGLDDVGGDVVTLGDGEDFETRLDSVSKIDQLGRPLRFAESDGAVSVGLSTPMVEEWAAGDFESLADDDDYATLARALDASQTAAAVFIEEDFEFGVDAVSGEESSDGSTEEIGQGLEDVDMIDQRFDLVAIGGAEIEGEVRSVVAYLFDDDDMASSAVDSIEQIWTQGSLPGLASPVDEYFHDVEVSADGRVVVVTSSLDDLPTSSVVDFAVTRSPLFTYR